MRTTLTLAILALTTTACSLGGTASMSEDTCVGATFVNGAFIDCDGNDVTDEVVASLDIPDAIPGRPGADGSSCSTESLMDGTHRVFCEDGSEAIIENGQDGRGITDIEVQSDGDLLITFTGDANPTNFGNIRGLDGASCVITDHPVGVEVTCGGNSQLIMDGVDGVGTPGMDGINVTTERREGENFVRVTGANGTVFVYDGQQGDPGQQGNPGTPGAPGAPAIPTDIVIEQGNCPAGQVQATFDFTTGSGTSNCFQVTFVTSGPGFIDLRGETLPNQSGEDGGSSDGTDDYRDDDGDGWCETGFDEDGDGYCNTASETDRSVYPYVDCDDNPNDNVINPVTLQDGSELNHPDAIEWDDDYDNNCDGIIDNGYTSQVDLRRD